MKYLIKPLTKKMISQLQAARAVELDETKGKLFPDDFRHSMGSLYRRGFIDTRKVAHGGREETNIYITDSGIRFLNQYKD